MKHAHTHILLTLLPYFLLRNSTTDRKDKLVELDGKRQATAPGDELAQER